MAEEDNSNSINPTAWLNAGSSLLSNVANGLFNFFTGKQSNQWAQEAATTAYERQRQLIAEQRAYDTPKANVMRLIEAGLNPNLAYGDLDLSAGSVASAPQANSASIAPARFDLDTSSMLQSQLLQAQIRELNSRADQRDALTPAQEREILASAGLKEKQADVAIAQQSEIQTSIELSRTSMRKMDAEISSLRAGTDLKIQEYNFNQSANPFRIRQIEEQSNLTHEQAVSYLRIVNATVNELISRSSLNKAHESYFRKQIELNDKDLAVKDALIGLYSSQEKLNVENKAYINLQKKVYERFGEANVASEIVGNLYSVIRDDGDLLKLNAKRARKMASKSLDLLKDVY